ncbi:hypothetical protein SUGI_0317140 [Cryptomeria japonica]|nr:hypothetical protein SUGI_0317140 [Cryptomeria japonica]
MNMNMNVIKWGTCEELLLGSAVERYGTQNWDLVAKQLQARLPCVFFSPEVCKAKYDALQGRFECSGTSWLEELRRLRVAQLRRELQRSDDSIGSLRSRLERLQGESGKSGGGKGGGSKACSERSKDRSSAGSFTEVADDGVQKTPERKREGAEKADGIENGGGVRDRESNPSPVREERATAPFAPAAADPDRAEVAGSNPPEAQVAPNPAPAVAPPPPPPPPPATVHHPTSPLDSFYGSSETLADEENRKPLHDFVESKRANLRSKQRSRRPRANAWAGFPQQPKAAMDSEAELPKNTPDDSQGAAAAAAPAAHHEMDGNTENSGLQTVETKASEKSFRRRRNQQGNKGLVVRSESSEEEGSGESMGEDKRVVDSDVLSSVLPPRESGGKGLSSSHEDYMSARSSGDSHMEGEGAEEIETSPMSRRNRREPKVPGKLLPLLECLRSISSHKFAPLFKHRLESQSKQQYRNMIRRHMDLGMIRARLEEGTYSGSREFFRDLLLIFNNALVYYPKSSQEYAAAWVLRQLASKEMENIFKTEALLKQEGPSTRKREPRKPSEPNSNAGKFNPSSIGRRRNTRLSSGGGRTNSTGIPRSARVNHEQYPSAKDEESNDIKEENNKPEEPKDAIDIASSAPPKPKPNVETTQKSEATNMKKLKDGSRNVAEGQQGKKVKDHIVKSFASNFQPKKISGIDKDPPRKSVTNETKRESSQKSNDEPKKPFGSIVQSPPSRALKKEQEEQESDPPPLKRGVGRPPKHARKGDDSTPSKSRKRAKR